MPFFQPKPRVAETTEAQKFFLYRILRQLTTPQPVNKRRKLPGVNPLENPDRYYVEIVPHQGQPHTLVIDRDTGYRMMLPGPHSRESAIRVYKLHRG
jgi:hypothetical protein